VESAQVFHMAAELALPAAEKLIEQTRSLARRLARAGIEAACAGLRADGHEVVAIGVVLGTSRLPDELEPILRSHPLIHTAEGELYRAALVDAGRACGLRVTGIAGKELYPRAAERFGLGADRLRRQLVELGRGAGKPWAQDQKESTLVARREGRELNRRAVLAFRALAIAALAACAGPRRFTPDDRASVAAVLVRQRDAWNRGDLDGFLSGYAATGQLVFTSGGQIRRGFEETRARYRARYGTDRKSMGLLEFEILDVQPAGADGAVVLGRWRLVETPNAGSGVFSVVMERRPEGWRIIHDHTSADPH
jgi:ketosteroid isomerase-like protein